MIESGQRTISEKHGFFLATKRRKRHKDYSNRDLTNLRSSVFIRGSKIYLLFPLCALVANQTVAAPRIVCDSPKYDFGTVIGQDEITHEYVLWNRGDSPVKISNIKNCCGVSSSITPMEILPGSNAVCKSVFTTRNRYGQQDKQILIASNDRKHPYYELKMVGTLLKPVESTPRLVRLGTLLPDSKITKTITATNLLDTTVELKSVSSAVKGIGAEIVESNERSWIVELNMTPALVPGKLKGNILLNFSSGVVSVPVTGAVKPVIQVVPEQIQFSSRSTNDTERLVMLRSGDGRKFDVLSAELVDADGQVELSKLADDRWQLKVAVKPNSIMTGTKLKLETSSQLQSFIEIPFLVK